MKVKEVAQLVGISVRTLHHYDEIGLLIPDQVTDVGYRLYSDDNLKKLQQILFFKELGFPLKQIKEMMDSPTYDQHEALMMQRNMLLEKQRRIDQMLRTLDKTIAHMKGDILMTNKERFEGFDFSVNLYEQEARERWGDKAVDEVNAKVSNINQQQFNDMFRKLSSVRHTSPQSDEAQVVIKEWYELLNTIHCYSLEAFKGLGQMYVLDGRFTNNIDQFGEGLAAFMCDAMAFYADSNK